VLDGPPERPDAAVSLLASTTGDAAYVQIIEARVGGEFATRATTDAPELQETRAGDVPPHTGSPQDSQDVTDLLRDGYVVLDGVVFGSGDTTLPDADIPALTDLAGLLKERPSLKIALVGHTDTTGSLDGNIRISKLRAEAVRAVLMSRYGIESARIEAEGMGYLAPRASNLTAQGREANRRVEAIALSED